MDRIPERLRTAAEGVARVTQMIADAKSQRNAAAGEPGAHYLGLEKEQTAEWQAAEMIESQRNEIKRLRAALVRIEKWFGEFPPTDATWPESGNPVSYGAQFGSNGERDFMRGIARDALNNNSSQ